jgi:hypothetical protein
VVCFRPSPHCCPCGHCCWSSSTSYMEIDLVHVLVLPPTPPITIIIWEEDDNISFMPPYSFSC